MPREGSTTTRGYGTSHQRLRARWAPVVAAGGATCARCGEPIEPGDAWDLGHAGTGRVLYSGPEHATCNRHAGQHAGERGDPQPRPRTNWST
ncbi:MAG: hypothetical protein ACRDQA_07575 [Nocardioidaceae bacterium]